jgi:peptidoglycan/xylan/chitin deacetylase (PgdA/CDA1 family)
MAIYYLSLTGSATPPYDTWEKAANNLNQIFSLGLTGENTIYVAGGIYTGSNNYLHLYTTGHSNLSIIGIGMPVFSPGTANVCKIEGSVHDIIIQNLKMSGSTSSPLFVRLGNNIIFENCIFHHTAGAYVLWLRNSSDAVFNRCYAETESYDTNSIVQLMEDASATFNYCCLHSPNGSPNYVFNHLSSHDAEVNNCILSRAKVYAAYHHGTGNLDINNSIIFGAGWKPSLYPPVHRESGAGEASVNNCIVLPTLHNPDTITETGISYNNNIYDDPKLTAFGNKGYIILRIDDSLHAPYAEELSSVMSDFNYRGTIFADVARADTNIETLRNLVQGGIIEVGVHSYSHSPLAYDHALHFEYTGSDANPTVELDSSGVIHLRTDGSDNVDIDTTQSNADTLGEIISNFSGTNNWTITKSDTDGQNGDNISDSCRSMSLAEMSATAAPCDIDFLKITNCENGCSGYYGSEIYNARIELTNLINAEGNIIDPQTGDIYEARTFVPPYGSCDDNVKEALRTSGYIGGKAVPESEGEELPINVYAIPGMNITELVVTGDEEETKKRAKLLAINIAVNGMMISITSHSEDEATTEEYRWILEGFKEAQKYYKINVTSMQLAIEDIKRHGTYDSSTGDVDIHWPMPPFRLRHDSPCIDAGVKLSIHDENWQDLAGNRTRYGSAPDIGCYEKKTWPLGAWGMLPWIGTRYKVQWAPYE